MSKNNKTLSDLLNCTKGLIVDLEEAVYIFDKLDPKDIDTVFSHIEKPLDWESKDTVNKVVYICRFENGRVLRSKFNIL